MEAVQHDLTDNITLEEVQAKFDAMHKHWQKEVRHTDAGARIKKLKKVRTWILDNEQRIIDTIYEDFKKPKVEATIAEVFPLLSEINHAIAHLREWMRPHIVDAPMTLIGTRSEVLHEPKGVVLIKSPWNYPFMLAIDPVISAVAAGCCVILKPSEMTPKTSHLIQEMIAELFDPNEVTVILGGVEVAQILLKVPFHHIFFTGSPRVGKIVMKAAAEHLTSVTLELGGENPVIVDETAALKDTAEKLIWGKFLSTGQSCLSPNYIYVHESRINALEAELKKFVEKIYPDRDDWQKNTNMGRIIDKRHFGRLSGMIQDALDKGAELVFGGKTHEADNFISPTILKNVDMSSEMLQDEIFGPIVSLIPYKNLDDVIEYINAKPRPLGLYVFSKSNKNIQKVINNTSSGSVAINDTTVQFTHPGLPFGGNNFSGIGNAHGKWGFMAFTNERSVLRQRRGLTSVKSLYPPYTPGKHKLARFFMKYFA